MKVKLFVLVLSLTNMVFAKSVSEINMKTSLYKPVVEKNVYHNLKPVHLAVINNNLTKLKKLLNEGADINALDSLMGNAPIHFAAQAPDVTMLKFLVENGAFVNQQSVRLGATPLAIAVWYRNVESVKYLLSLPDTNTKLPTAFGMNAIELNDFGPNENDKCAINDINEITVAFNQREVTIQKQLNEQSSIYKVVISKLGENEKINKIKLLIEQGADVNAISPVLNKGNDFHTALLVAARDGDYNIAKLLLDAGADQTIPGSYMAAIPLHKAAYFGRADMLKLLSNYPGFDKVLDIMGPNNGYTPLHDAIWHGHTEAAKFLINEGAATDIVAFDGLTPYSLAQKFGYQDIVRLIDKKNDM